ncbi:MAG: Mur ligase family protein [Microthrixaceae bacterium]
MEISEALRWHDARLDHETTSRGIAAGQVEGLSLQSMRELMELLGDPQDQVPVIHITGTNGKGTVAAMVTALLQAHGLRVGTYTSPHLLRVNERIARDGEPISDSELAEVLTGIAAVEPLLADQPSWFEVITAAAFRWFAEAPVEVAVVEVGLLGRTDSTNVVNAEVAVVTAIQGDHTDFAAGWELAVATEKAGILKPMSTAVLGEIPEELVAVFAAEGPARLLQSGVDFEVLNDRLAIGGHLADIQGVYALYNEVFLPVHGRHQVVNAAISVAAVESFFARELDPEVIHAAFAEFNLPGRFEILQHSPLVVIDGAHNPDALSATALTIEEEFAPVGTRIVVLGALFGRDARRLVAAVAELRPDLVICCSLDGPRGVEGRVLAAACDELGIPQEVVADPGSATARALAISAEEDMILVTGSFRVLEPARVAVRQSNGQ